MSGSSAVEVTHEAGQRRFVAEVDGGEAVAEYVRDGRRVTFTHTVVPPQAEGQGVGSALAKAAFDHARAEGLQVIPQCPFIADWVRKNPGYHEVVAEEWRARLLGGGAG